MHELIPHLLHATEAAALATAAHVGRGDKLAADCAATEALRSALAALPVGVRVVIGEGEKDEAPGLFLGDILGPSEPQYDLAVDPIDGTTQAARGEPDALVALALGRRGALLSSRTYYLHKLAVGPDLAPGLARLGPAALERPVADVVTELAAGVGKRPGELTVAVLDRPRHAALVGALQAPACRIALQQCDVSATVAAGLPGRGIDLSLGIGGAPEAVLCAAALKCLGGAVVGRLVNTDWTPTDGRVLLTDDLAGGDVLFCATGITSGMLLDGVRGGATHSLCLASADRGIHWVRRPVDYRGPVRFRTPLP